jgi:hypothetical protein
MCPSNAPLFYKEPMILIKTLKWKFKVTDGWVMMEGEARHFIKSDSM